MSEMLLDRAGRRRSPATIQEALSLGEADLDQRRGSLLVRHGKGGRRREVGMERCFRRPGSGYARQRLRSFEAGSASCA
jgi:hypothetical protein